MAAAMGIGNVVAIAALNAKVDAIDTGGGTAVLRIYSGTRPDKVDTVLSGNTLLAELNLSNPAFGAAADANPNAIATASAITDDSSANATGTASFFRVLDRAGTAVIDGNVGTSGEDLNLDSVSITSGQTVSISSWTITEKEEP